MLQALSFPWVLDDKDNDNDETLFDIELLRLIDGVVKGAWKGLDLVAKVGVVGRLCKTDGGTGTPNILCSWYDQR